MMRTVPFNKPVVFDEVLSSVQKALQNGQVGGDGAISKQCEELLQKITHKPARLSTSATHALELMGLLANIKPGDEVILPAFTFVSTASAFALRGAKLCFADNDANGNILPAEIERLFTQKTRAVVAVHYAGASADLDKILEICNTKKVPLFEDAAQAIGAEYKGRPLGTIGALGAFSFHETKNLSAGEGGALLFGDTDYLERAEILREKGTNRKQFLMGQVDKYTWVDLGSSYILSDLNAAYLLPQLERLDEITKKRGQIWNRYYSEFKDVFAKQEIRVLETPSYNTPNYHMFAAMFPTTELRSKFMTYMKSQGISCPFHYVSLHTSKVGRTFYQGEPEKLPGCERLAQTLVRFPLYYNMSDDDVSYVIEKTRSFF